MAKKIIVFIFLFLVIVHMKDGTKVYFEKGDRGLVHAPGNFGDSRMWLSIEAGTNWDSRTIASFNWDNVEYYENK